LSVSLLEKFEVEAEKTGSILLDASSSHGAYGRFSLMATNPFLIFQSKENRIQITTAEKTEKFLDDPLLCFENLLAKYRHLSIESFWGPGAIGFLSYELGYQLQNLPRQPMDDLDLPDLWFAFYDTILLLDHVENKISMMGERCENPIPNTFFQYSQSKKDFPKTSLTQKTYEKAFGEVMRQIEMGNAYQINLCRRFSTPFKQNPWQCYGRLRALHPTPLSAFLNTGEFLVLSASPELFLKKDGYILETCPIKGTISKSKANAKETLLKSQKDRAEHVMIVDLERNDLGKVCQPGSVSPQDLMRIEECGSVYHMVTTVKGKLKNDIGLAEILRSTFPGGSITGAPKKSAMKIIGSVEPCVRGVYTGALGWIGFSGNFILNLPIRTLLIKDGFAHFYAGGGVVADSTPFGEYEEIVHKGEAFLKILNLHEPSFQSITHISV
jgi:para-aminobenzoate synthetase component 1